MNYRKKYEKALERAKGLLEGMDEGDYFASNEDIENIFPELKKESKDEQMIERLKSCVYASDITPEGREEILAWLEKQEEPKDKGEISDGYHTFNELYEYRKLYNAAFFNLLPKELVHKSKKHHDGEECFGGGWFIVMANLPTGQISNHYELKDWDLFQIPEKEVADEWDGHTPQDAADRLHKYLLEKQDEENNTYIINNTPNCGISVYTEKLDESEDERIRKELIELISCMHDADPRKKGWIAWLEKQKEKDHCIGCTNDKGCVTCEHGELQETPTRTINADEVIAWLVANICHFEHYVKLFKKDFGL